MLYFFLNVRCPGITGEGFRDIAEDLKNFVSLHTLRLSFEL